MPANQRQIDYIEILCNDVGFDTRVKKMDFVSNLLGWKVPYLDEIAIPEASRVIEKLKFIKNNQDEGGIDPGDRFDAFRND